jgi:hypothetical protein
MPKPTPTSPNALRDGALTVAGLYASLAIAGATAPHWEPTVVKLLSPPVPPTSNPTP